MRIRLLFTIFAMLAATGAWAQTTFLQGRVVDGNRKPISGASVLVAGTNTGTTTDNAGNYALLLPGGLPRTAIIRFSMLGMGSFETPWNGQGIINATLYETVITTNTAVVRAGLIDLNVNEYTGAHSSLNLDSMVAKPTYSDLSQMLQGEIAGMQVVNTSMRAGAAPRIQIRGQSTLLGTTSPLWVVDGIVQPEVTNTTSWGDVAGDDMDEYLGSAISWLNPQDVESVTVLKDASATAIYGSRASNGVIVVTTKRGKADQLSVRAGYNISVGQQMNYNLYNLMNSQERINFSKEAFESGVYYPYTPLEQPYTYEGMYRMYLNGRMNDAEFARQYNYLETVNTDWLKLLTRPSLNHNASLSVTGGTDKANFMMSASYNKQQATERGNDSERFTGRLAVDVKLSPKLRLATSLMSSVSKTTGFANSGLNPITYATTTSRAIPAYNQDGSLAYYSRHDYYKYNDNTKIDGLPYNVLDDLANVGSTVNIPTMQASLDFKWSISDAFNYQVVAGYTNSTRRSDSWMGENSYHVLQGFRGYLMESEQGHNADYRAAAVLKTGGILITDHLSTNSYNVRNQLNFSKSITENHRLTAMAMWEVSSSTNTSKYNTVWGYDKIRGEQVNAPTIPNELRPIGTSTPAPSDYIDTYQNLNRSAWRSSRTVNNMASLAMIAAYSMHGKYVINANFRNDWSNAFGQNANRRFNPAWSLGVSWRLADEEFMESMRNWLNQANFRLTYGTQGNLGNTLTTEMIMEWGNRHALYEQPYSWIKSIANPYMTWERTKSWNGGLDLGLFDNKITVVLDGYRRMSDVGRKFQDTPENGGFQSTLTGTYIRNTGFEATVSFTPLKTEHWRLAVGANMGKNWSKIVSEKYSESTTYTIDSYINGQSESVIVAGRPVGAFWAYPYAGPDAATGIPTFHNFHYGNYTAAEMGRRTTDIMRYMGTRISDITSGITLRLSYRDFTLSTQLAATIGGKNFLPNPYAQFPDGRMPDATANLSNELLDRWTKNNTGSQIPGLYVVPNESAQSIYLTDPTSKSGTYKNIYNMWGQSDARVASITTLRCNAMNFTWRVNTDKPNGAAAAMLKKTGVKNMDLTVGVNNLFLLADKRWRGMDPDLGGDRRMPRSFSFGINFGF